MTVEYKNIIYNYIYNYIYDSPLCFIHYILIPIVFSFCLSFETKVKYDTDNDLCANTIYE